MLYPFMTLEDETEIVHSEPLTVDGKEKVKVVIEQPVTGGFHSAVCWLPDYTWEKIEGFSCLRFLRSADAWFISG